MATKKKASSKGSSKKSRPGPPIIVDGAPITIGGGGGEGGGKRITSTPVWCEFNHGVYQDPGGGPGMKKFENQNLSMQSLQVTVGAEVIDLSPFLPADRDCKVTVDCQNSNERLTIQGKELGIEFHTGKYPQVSSVRHSNPSGNTYIGKVEIKASGLHITKSFSPSDLFAVKASNLPVQERGSKSRRAKR
jgi:hypothetical protein